MNQDFIEPVVNRDINYTKILGTLLSRWYWIAGCIAITVFTTWLYLSLIHPRYSANASVMLNDKKSGISQILSNSAEEAKNTYEAFNLSQSAIAIIRSDPFLAKAVSRLNYRFSFYVKEFGSNEELYPESPFRIQIIKQDTSNVYDGLFSIIRSGKGKFKLSHSELTAPTDVYSYGDTIRAQGLVFRVLSSYSNPNKLYYFRFHTKASLIQRAALYLSVEPQNANILSLTHTDVNPYFSADILNAIAEEFVIYESYQRKSSEIQRLKFIDDRLDTLKKEVSNSGEDLEAFKKSHGLDNLPQKLQNDITKMSQFEAQKQQLQVESISINQIEAQIAANDTKAMLNFNIEGPIGSMLSTLVSQLNDQIIERDRKLTTYNANSAPVLESDQKIATTKQAIASNIRQLRRRNDENQQYVAAQIASSRAALDDLPSDAKDLITLQTDITIKQKIFSNLTEEKLKSSIALAAIEPGASIIYYASPSSIAVWPVRNRIYLIGLMVGLGAGVFFIFLARYLNRYIRDVGTVEYLTSIPIMGMVRKAGKILNPSTALLELKESVFSESIRSLRNSMLFVLNETGGKIITISSEVSGEGRSFIASNLAISLAQLDKKVIIVDSDLRTSPEHKLLNSGEVGLSSYLTNLKPLTGVIKHTEVNSMDIIPGGMIPANPSELLRSDKTDELLIFLKNIYDYVIIDTSPIGVVSDAIPMLEKADVNLFVVRSGKSKFNSTSQMEKIAFDYKLDNFFVVLNAFKKNPLYQPFYSSTNTDIYFNKYYSDYIKKNSPDNDGSKWKLFSKVDR